MKKNLMRVGVLISGRGSNMMALIEGAKDYKVVLVLAHDEVEGIAKARVLGVSVGIVAKNDAVIDKKLKQHGVDFIVLAGYMRVLGAEFVQNWHGALVNIHPSLLPRYKGLHSHERVLQAGEKEHGCSLHWVSEQLDAGEIIAQKRLQIKFYHTKQSLARDVLALEHQLLPEEINRIARGRIAERERSIAPQQQRTHQRVG